MRDIDLLPEIMPSGKGAALTSIVTLPPTSSEGPLAAIQQIVTAPGDPDTLYALDTRGVVWAITDGVVAAQPLLDLRGTPGFVSLGGETGLRSIAFHPGFADPASPGFGKMYTTYEAPVGSLPAGVPLFQVPLEGPATEVLFHDVLSEWTVTSTGGTLAVDPASERQIFRVEEAFRNHNINQIVFDPNAAPGDADYGLMYLGIGDGGDAGDPNDNARNLEQIQGKVLRFDPLEQADGSSFGSPADNPYAGAGGGLDFIWASGFRNPQSLSFDSAGHLLVGDIGQGSLEEINVVVKGADYGWNEREGTFVYRDGLLVRDLPTDDAANGYHYPYAEYDHQEIADNNPFGAESAAITMGVVYEGEAIPELKGQLLFADFTTGRIFHVPAGATLERAMADGIVTADEHVQPQELTLYLDGKATTLLDILGGPRADLRFGVDAAGEVYVFTKTDGQIYRLDLTGERQSLGEAADRTTGSSLSDVYAGNGGDDFVDAGAGNDEVSGGAGGDWLGGGLGADALVGGIGDDRLVGQAGADILKGGAGDDVLKSGGGDDRLEGGAGDDLFVFRATRGSIDRVLDFQDGDRLAFSGFGSAYDEAQKVLQAAEQVGGDTVITLHDGGRTSVIVLADVDRATLDAADLAWINS